MYIIIITSNSCYPFHVGKIYKTEKQAEQGVKQEQKTWDSRDWYKLECNIIKLKNFNK